MSSHKTFSVAFKLRQMKALGTKVTKEYFTCVSLVSLFLFRDMIKMHYYQISQEFLFWKLPSASPYCKKDIKMCNCRIDIKSEKQCFCFLDISSKNGINRIRNKSYQMDKIFQRKINFWVSVLDAIDII